jgi:hypothetical protein
MTPRKRMGRIQRQISRAFRAHPGATFHTTELARRWVYPRCEKIARWQYEAVRRAAKRVAVRVGRDEEGLIFGGKSADKLS